jgi:hypothetical protein
MTEFEKYLNTTTDLKRRMKIGFAIVGIFSWSMAIFSDILCITPLPCKIVFEIIQIFISFGVPIFLDFQDWKNSKNSKNR